MRNQWVVLWSLWAARLVRQPTLPVLVSGGRLRGEVAPDGSHRRYLAVPYATHPEKRFQDPAPEPTWNGIYEAIEENVYCIQMIGTFFVIGRLECLTLNIYTPNDIAPKRLKPVMVFIHGGGFYSGSGSHILYGPKYLIRKDIILVTINYRLNILGFSCFRIREAPGNAALKDQVAALRWIQRNIKAFGGDPDNVTIFGESAGSASVSLHILSPMSKGLFHKAIMQSGSSLSTWALQFRPVYIASLLAKAMGHNVHNATDIYNILSRKTEKELIVTRIPRSDNNVVISEVVFSPCIEDEIDGVEPFLTEAPYNLLSKGQYNKVPIVIGSNSAEGLFIMSFENDTTIPNIKFEKALPEHFKFSTDEEKQSVAKRLGEFYANNKNDVNNLMIIAQFQGEAYLTHPILEETELYLKTNDKPVYSYYFNYDGYRNFPKLYLSNELSKVPNATHADDLFYLFSQAWSPSFFEHEMIERITTLWTNFAKYGDPTPSVTDLLPVRWQAATTSSPQSLFIDSELTMVPLWATESLRYLKEVYSKYRRKGE